MVRRLSTAAVVALSLLIAQATAAFAAANPAHSSCLAQFVSGQEPGDVGESITGNLADAHPFGIVVISFTAVLKAPCFEE
jgi:hypothetical protein